MRDRLTPKESARLKTTRTRGADPRFCEYSVPFGPGTQKCACHGVATAASIGREPSMGGTVKAKAKKESKTKESKAKPLPKTWRGAAVVRGQGMNSDDLDTFMEKKAMDGFDAKREMWIVVEDRALEDLDDSVPIKGFSDKDDAIRFAQACANGNVDHRVLRVTDQVLVVGTMNDL